MTADPVRSRPFVWTVLPGLVLVALGLVVFFAVLDGVREHDDLWNLDQPVLNWLVAHRTPAWTAVLATITFVSGPIVLPIAVGVGCLVWGRLRREWWRPVLLAGAMAASTLLGLVVKGLVDRPRPPSETMLVPGAEHTASFPSGHTLGTATLFLVAGYLVCSRRPTPGRLVAWGVATVVGTVLVALSRLYLGYHFVTDVVASVALAVVVLGVVSIIDRRHTGRVP
jgi:membrane-associated phospholipid phosphatase